MTGKSGQATELSNHQKHILDKVHACVVDDQQPSTALGGLAGTGKTTLIGHIHDRFGLSPSSIAYCAFTGKATTVVNRRFPAADATTIHKLIYRAADWHCASCPTRQGGPCDYDTCGECGVRYMLREKLQGAPRLVVVDEASMVPEILYDHLLMYQQPIIWVGDHGQLPPVKSAFNVVEHPDYVLEKIHRQAADSPIVQLAHLVRRVDHVPRPGVYDEGSGEVRVTRTSRLPGFDTEEFDRGELAFLVPTNHMRVAVNKAVRKALGRDPDEPQVGDRVVCLRNNDSAGIYNGLCGVVRDVTPAWYGQPYHALVVDIEGEDRQYAGKAYAKQFNNREGLGHRVPRKEADLWDYGYALTVHKAQGSEYDRVVLIVDLSKTSSRRRWLYTAITRAKKQLEIVYPD